MADKITPWEQEEELTSSRMNQMVGEANQGIGDVDLKTQEHQDSNIPGADGVHGLRIFEEKLQYKNEEDWLTINTGGGGGGGGGASTAQVQIITIPNGAVTVAKDSEQYTATADAYGVASFDLGLGFWDVAANENYKIIIDQVGKLYTFTPADKLSLEQLSWGWIDLICKKGLAQQYFNLGDTKNIAVNGEPVTCQLAGMEHDDLTSGGKAQLTFIFYNSLKIGRRMNATAINSTSWRDSELRTLSLPAIWDTLPQDLKTVIKKTNKKTATSGANATLITTSDDIWIPSAIEVFGTSETSYAGEGAKYPIFIDTPNRIKTMGNGGNAGHWWTRSPYNVSNNATNFVYVSSAGVLSSHNALNTLGVAVGFCV